MAHIVNPYNLDDDDDAVFSALLSQGLIWVEDDDDDNHESEIEEINGLIHVIHIDPSLQKATIPEREHKHSHSSNTHGEQESARKSVHNYEIDEVLQAIHVFIRGRNEDWVNFSRVALHLYKTFPNINLKQLGRPAKNYKSLLKLIADYPSDFELWLDSEKQGLYWIRLKQK
jgi:hypothetical protein